MEKTMAEKNTADIGFEKEIWDAAYQRFKDITRL